MHININLKSFYLFWYGMKLAQHNSFWDLQGYRKIIVINKKTSSRLNVVVCCQHSLSQPHFWKNVRMTLTLPKWGLGSPLGLLKLQSSIAGVKTPCLEAFFKSLESYRSVDVENGLA
jgi:hypothetical protein